MASDPVASRVRAEAGSARQRLLAAGAELFDDLPRTELLAGLSVSALARRAGTTRATFYHHWPNVEVYLDDLARLTFEDSSISWVGPAREDLAGLAAKAKPGTPSRAEHIRSSSQLEIDAVLDDPRLPLRLVLSARSDEPTRAALRARYARLDATAISTTVALWRVWGREPRPPFDHPTIAALWAAIADGLVLRRLVDDSFDAGGVYANVLLALLPMVSRDVADGRDLDECRYEIGRFGPIEPYGPASTVDEPPVPAALARRTVQTVLTMLDDQAWPEVSLVAVAERTGAPVHQLTDLFGSRAGLGAIVLSQLTARRVRGVVGSDDPTNDLRAALDALRQAFGRYRQLAQSAALIATGNAPRPRPAAIEGMTLTEELLAEQIVRAQEAGQLRGDLAPTRLARHWSCTLLVDETVQSVADAGELDVVGLLLAGAALPRSAPAS